MPEILTELSSLNLVFIALFAGLIIGVLVGMIIARLMSKSSLVAKLDTKLAEGLLPLQQENNSLLTNSENLRQQQSQQQSQQDSRYQLVKNQLDELNNKYLNAKTEVATLKERLEQSSAHYEDRLQELRNARESLTKEFENLANKIFDSKQEKFAQQNKTVLDNTLDPVRRELKDFRKKVEDVYDKESAERNQLMGQVVELQKQAQQVSSDAANLASALKSDNKAAGNWGEVVLERLLEESGLTKGREYETQAAYKDATGKTRLPDVVIHLPENRDIVVDSKVSLVDFERFCSADEDTQRAQALKQHIASVRAHVNGLSKKDYQSLPGINTLDFVLIFVPIEGAFMLALQEDHTLFRDAYDQGIILVSPSTLLATLRTINNIWRYEDQNRNAEKIADGAGKLYDQFVRLIDSMDEVGKHLDKAHQAWDTSQQRLHMGRGNLVKRVEDIKKLGAKTKKKIPEKNIERAIDEDSIPHLENNKSAITEES